MTVERRLRAAARGLKGVFVLGVLSVLGSSGCLYVNIERGGAAGARHMQVSMLAPGNLSESVGTDFLTTWQTAHAALCDLNMNIVSEARTTDAGSIECVSSSQERIRIQLEGKNPQQTEVDVRWTTLEDRVASRQILDRISLRVANVMPLAQPLGTPVAIAPPVVP